MAAPQRLTDRKRVAIVDAAIAEFRDHGFDATSMDRIAATAAVSKRTVYNHFPSKDELFAEILQRMWESSVSQPAVPYVADQPLRPQVLALVEQKMELLCDPTFIDLARVIFGETIHSPERAQAMVARLNEKETGLNIWIRAAQQDGRIKAGETLEVAHLLMSPLKTFAFWPQITMGEPLLGPARQREVAELAVDIFLCYYGVAKQTA
ncbi:transcriptional regulator, TetR family [Janthinobacterium lividum]|uniref:Transcriptional regulator, TetR family n=1 Tax=Janthinobacterium lividum TaxID=29581 RepID=A0AB38CDP0_9BURK|nr:TetR/AcrR family transcriptional regulator [Janthinobacterium lividum]SFY12249.1 transcriptional regulator, TetR family [Janthinobacterium lividum]